jgi:DNA modification methylase
VTDAPQPNDDDVVLPESPGDVHPRNTLNQLSGREWLYFTKSVLRTSYPSILGHDLRRQQGGNKPPQLMAHFIAFFTKPDALVLDPFAGAGGTLLGAHLTGRRAIGIEINPESAEIYREVCRREQIVPMPVEIGDCRVELKRLGDGSIDFIATDPPYSIKLAQTMSGDRANAKYNRVNRKSGYVDYSGDISDLSNLPTFSDFFTAMRQVGAELFRVLRPSGYAVMIIRDAYQDGEYIPTSYRIATDYQSLGFRLKAINVWYATGTRIRPYGYPNAYVPNLVHQNVVILQKPANRVRTIGRAGRNGHAPDPDD